jgi:formate dehydrogenase assembly factor FdhD
MMLDLVFRRFFDDPPRRWQWLAHASVMAKHALNDLPLALKYAQALADQTDDTPIPSWARQMHMFLRADMGEHAAAKILLGGLLASGTVHDPHEIAFLMQRLEKLEEAENSPVKSKN